MSNPLYQKLSKLLRAARDWHIAAVDERPIADACLLASIHELSDVDIAGDYRLGDTLEAEPVEDRDDEILGLERTHDLTQQRLNELRELYKIAKAQLEESVAERAKLKALVADLEDELRIAGEL